MRKPHVRRENVNKHVRKHQSRVQRVPNKPCSVVQNVNKHVRKPQVRKENINKHARKHQSRLPKRAFGSSKDLKSENLLKH